MPPQPTPLCHDLNKLESIRKHSLYVPTCMSFNYVASASWDNNYLCAFLPMKNNAPLRWTRYLLEDFEIKFESKLYFNVNA